MNSARIVVDPAPGGFATALSEAIDTHGITLSALAEQLAARELNISLTTLSYWRSGRRYPTKGNSITVVAAIEEILGVPDRELTTLLSQVRRIPVSATEHNAGLVRGLLTQLGLADDDALTMVSAQVVINIDAQGEVSSLTTREIRRAVRAGAHRMPLVFAAEKPADGLPRIADLRGVRLGQRALDEANGVLAQELLIDGDLEVGEEVLTEHTLDLPPGCADDVYEYYAPRRMEEVLIWIRFAEARLPVSASAYTVNEKERLEAPLDTEGVHAVQQAVRRFGPGVVGIRWGW